MSVHVVDCSVKEHSSVNDNPLFSSTPLLSQPNVQLKSCPRLRNPAWPAVWSAGEKRWSLQAPTSSQSPRSSSWRKALVSVKKTLQKLLVPVTCACQIVSERPPWIKSVIYAVCWTLKKRRNLLKVVNLHLSSYTWNLKHFSSCKCCRSKQKVDDFIWAVPHICPCYFTNNYSVTIHVFLCPDKKDKIALNVDFCSKWCF